MKRKFIGAVYFDRRWREMGFTDDDLKALQYVDELLQTSG
jgi:hypothetical protein